MTDFLRSGLLLTLLALPVLTATVSCSKKEEAPAPTTGGLSGTVMPADAVTTVTVDSGQGAATVSPNGSTGEFSVANLAPGAYKVRFTPAPGFLPVADRYASVAAGQTYALGAVRASAFVAGSVDGTVRPAGSVLSVQLTAPGATQGPTTQPDAAGYFRFAGVAPGTYNVVFQTTSSYITPAPRSVTVAASANAALGAITVDPTGPSTTAATSGSATWRDVSSNIVYRSTRFAGSVFFNSGLPTGFSFTATAQRSPWVDVLNLYCNGAAPGLYVMNRQTAHSASYLRTYNGQPSPTYTTQNFYGNAGTVTITSFDAAARTISGTFGFTAYDAPQSNTYVGMSDGTFTLSY